MRILALSHSCPGKEGEILPPAAKTADRNAAFVLFALIAFVFIAGLHLFVLNLMIRSALVEVAELVVSAQFNQEHEERALFRAEFIKEINELKSKVDDLHSLVVINKDNLQDKLSTDITEDNERGRGKQ